MNLLVHFRFPDTWHMPPSCSLPFSKTPRGRLAIDGHLRVLMPPKLEASGHVRADGEQGPGPKKLTDVSEQAAWFKGC